MQNTNFDSLPLPSQILRNKFPHEPTESQSRLFEAIDQFIGDQSKKSVFVLKGYAGTGKTTSIASLIKVLPLFNYKYVMLAPTGRAAKVISQYAKRTAFTIHKKIYKSKHTEKEGLVFKLTKNYHSNTLFIVDEASMIHSESSGQNLLRDLIQFTFEGKDNKLMLVGDDAQLPPVMQEKSLALDPSYLHDNYHCSIHSSILTNITRQAAESGIIANATSTRISLKQKKKLSFNTKDYQDIYRMNSDKLEDGLLYAHNKYGLENTLIISRSNRNAVQYNHFIRNQLFYKEDELDAGDLLLVAKNNYSIADSDIPSGFIANGDFIEILKVKKYEEQYGFRFADAEIRFIDYENSEPLSVKLMLNTLHSHAPAMTQEENRSLYQAVLGELGGMTKKEQKEEFQSNPYLNALQVKYAYALTCHKAQGGQWDAVFVDQGYIHEDQSDEELAKWVYTAITRAKKELFLVNFDTKFFLPR